MTDCAFLHGGVFFMSKNSMSVKEIVLMAFYLALFYVPAMPQGGSLGLGTIALLMASYQLGWKKGTIVGLLSVLLQFVSGRMYVLGPVQFLLDYIIPFGIYGIACLFPNYGMFYSGILITNLIRFFSHTLSGVFFYETPWIPSMIYQASYMVPTTIVGLIMVPLLMKYLAKRLEKAI